MVFGISLISANTVTRGKGLLFLCACFIVVVLFCFVFNFVHVVFQKVSFRNNIVELIIPSKTNLLKRKTKGT